MRKARGFMFGRGGVIVALIMALTLSPVGLAFAVATLTGLDIVDGSIKTVDLGKAAVTNRKLAANSVGTAKIIDGSIQAADLAAGVALSGPSGATGAQGIQGLQGIRGLIGLSGLNGINGTNGVDGAIGATGPTGPTGAQGPQGNVGPAGANGSDGATGTPGLQGTQGIQGIQGATGTPGPTYTAGADISIDASNTISVDTTFLTVAWGNLAGMPAGFADTVDNDTLYTAGSNLTLVGDQFAVSQALLDRITALEATATLVAGLQQQIDAQQTEINNLWAAIAGLNATDTLYLGRLGSHDTSLTDHETRIQSLETSVFGP